MVLSLNFCRSMQNHNLPSFFLTSTTTLAQGLANFLIAPISNISLRCLFTSSYCRGGILLYLSLKGSGLVSIILCLTTGVFPKSVSSRASIHLNSSIHSLTSVCSFSDQLEIPSKLSLEIILPFVLKFTFLVIVIKIYEDSQYDPSPYSPLLNLL